jgi:hypothetical protein
MSPSRPLNERGEAKQDMRRKVIALLMSWKPAVFGTWSSVQMRYVPDMQKIYQWVNTYGLYKPKWLNKHTYKELVDLVSQITKITSSRDAKTKEEKKP